MAIPTYQQLMLPLLKLAGDGKEHPFRETVDHLAKLYTLTDAELRERLSSGGSTVFYNRVGWALTDLKRAGFIAQTRRGCFRITDRGLEVLKLKLTSLDSRFMRQYKTADHVEPSQPKKTPTEPPLPPEPEATPDESLERAYQTLREGLAADLLDQLKAASPSLFERIVVEVLVSMGYGGSLLDAGKAIGQSGDEGIDGTIKEDPLGLDIIYIQAKKWENPVSRPEIQKFAGALQGQRARKGVFITTSRFSKEAEQFARGIESKIALIDGQQLADLMIDHNIGVTLASTYLIKRLDKDYFLEE